MENTVKMTPPPEGYRYKLVKKGTTEAQKRAQKAYHEKNKEKIREKNKLHNKERYDNDPEYKKKTQDRMRETMRRKKAALQPTEPPTPQTL